jgi:hypothetical protein
VLLSVLISLSFSATCPPQQDVADLPLCPPGQVISENYPVKAIAISSFPLARNPRATNADDVVLKILSHSGENPPQILLSAPERVYKDLLSAIDQMPGSEEIKNKRKAAIVRTIQAPAYWQQDFFESFIDPKTGSPILREVAGYKYAGSNLFEPFSKDLNNCEYPVGDKLSARTHHSGLEGGNIEALPGGICVLGNHGFESDVDWNKYADQFCGTDKDKRVMAPTDWLSVGHADEIMKVIRNKNRPAPCDFSIGLSSPRLAFQLLMENSQEKFMAPNLGDNETNRAVASTRYQSIEPLRDICAKAKEIFEESTPPFNKPKSGLSQLLYWFFIPKISRAAVEFSCESLTNGQVMNTLNQDENFKAYNFAVQEKMEHFKEDMRAKLKKSMPNCEPDFFDVPDFFAPKPLENKMGKKVLPKKSSMAILSNSTNSMSVNDLIITGDPNNDSFRRYLNAQYAARGLKVEMFDMTDTYRHGRGSLHCLSHTIHHCRPRPK